MVNMKCCIKKGNHKILLMRGPIWQGAVCSGLKIFVRLWCTEKKGPVFSAMFDPVSTVFVALLAYFLLGEDFIQHSRGI